MGGRAAALLVLLAAAAVGSAVAQLPREYRDPVTMVRCPVRGGYKELKRAGARLMEEGNVLWSQACFKEAMRAAMSGEEEETHIPMSPGRFREVYPTTASRPDEEFDSVRALVERNHLKTLERYSIRRLHLTPQEGDYFFRRRRPAEVLEREQRERDEQSRQR